MQKSINWEAIKFDWNHVRAFLAAADEGSLSAAARVLGQTQPTLSRQITALEEDLGVLLLERGTRGLTLTESGLALLEHVRAMGQAAAQVSLAATGQSKSVDGHVTITTTNAFATYHLPRMLKRVREEAPLLQVTLVTSNEVRDITRREADISIRHAEPTQPDLIGKQVGLFEAHVYAAREYLNEVGRPQSAAACASLDYIGFDKAETLLPVLNGMGVPVTKDNFKIITASGQWHRYIAARQAGTWRNYIDSRCRSTVSGSGAGKSTTARDTCTHLARHASRATHQSSYSTAHQSSYSTGV